MTEGGPSVLVIEDDPTFAEVVVALLPHALSGARPRVAASLKAGIAEIDALPPDVVVLDLELPDSAGLDTLRSIVPHASGAAIVVITGTEDVEIGVAALQHGAVDHLVKTEVTRAAIGRTLRHALERRRLEKEIAQQRVSRPVVRALLRDIMNLSNLPDAELVGVGRRIATEVRGATVADLVDSFERLGLGSRVKWEALSPTRYRFEAHELLERRADARHATCHLALGYFSGAVARIRPGAALGAETTCESRGGAACTFVIESR